MANEEQLKILKNGPKAWNKWRKDNPDEKIDLSNADIGGADLCGTDLTNAALSKSYLSGADLSSADLTNADLSKAKLSRTYLYRAKLSEAKLSGAYLSGANLTNVRLQDAEISSTLFVNVDLSVAEDLLTIKHYGPSSIGTDTLIKSKGKIPAQFLRQCGLSPWEIEFAKLYNPDLKPYEIAEILDVNVFGRRTEGPLYIGGIFISYSHENSDFVDKLYELLREEGAAVWLDRHDMEAGPIQKQVTNQIRIMDILLIVLSKASVNSDWVENELEQAREREKKEKRDIICPVALDDSWKDKIKGDPLWRQVAKYNILDFSGWKTKKFNPQFQRLVNGIKKNYQIFYKDGNTS